MIQEEWRITGIRISSKSNADVTKEEYIRKMNEENDWAPGWDAIEAEFSRLYPGQNPAHFGTSIQSRAMFGGDEYLDGFSVYTNPDGYMHLVTFGMTELYCEPDAFGGEYSRWGYEMTMKLKEDTPENCMWAINMLSNLARYTSVCGQSICCQILRDTHINRKDILIRKNAYPAMAPRSILERIHRSLP